MPQNLQYDVTSTSAPRSFNCLYLTMIDLFDYQVTRKGNF